ncbi:MAG: guanylate kinase [Actinomycetota bacterium]|nr:guanylate kinase [Actinomycetota bacterium]
MPHHHLIFVVSGPGGVGKGTVVQRLVDSDKSLWLSRSWTTRPRRRDEGAEDYVFVDRSAFMERVVRGGFLEWTTFPGNGHLYGTPTPDPPPERDVLLEIELDGARQIRSRYPEAVIVLIVAPSVEVQRERLRGRGDAPDSVEARVRVGVDEERDGRSLADHVVVNDEVNRAAVELAGIVGQHRSGC